MPITEKRVATKILFPGLLTDLVLPENFNIAEKCATTDFSAFSVQC